MASFATIAVVALLGVVGSLAQDTVQISSGHQRVNRLCVGSSKLAITDVLPASALFTDEVDTVFAGNSRKLSQEYRKSIICTKLATYTYAGGKFEKSKLLAPWKTLAWQAVITSKTESVGSKSPSAAFKLVDKFFKDIGATLPTGLFANFLIEEHASKTSTKSATLAYLFCDGSAQKCYFTEGSTNVTTLTASTLTTVSHALVNPQGCGWVWNGACACYVWVCN